MSPPHVQWWTLPVLDLFMREKLRSDTFWTDHVCAVRRTLYRFMGSCGWDCSDCRLLGFDPMCVMLPLSWIWRNWVQISLRFVLSFLIHLSHGVAVWWDFGINWDSNPSTLKMEAGCFIKNISVGWWSNIMSIQKDCNLKKHTLLPCWCIVAIDH